MNLKKTKEMSLESTKKDFREFEYLKVGNYVRYENRFWKVEKINDERETLNLRSIAEPYLSVKIDKIEVEVIGIKLTKVYLDKLGFVENTKKEFDTFEIGKLILTQYPYLRTDAKENIGGGIGIYCLYNDELIQGMCTAEDRLLKSYSISTIHALQNYLQKPSDTIDDKEKIDFDKIVPQLKPY